MNTQPVTAVAVIRTYNQCGPDQFENTTRVLMVDDNTTVGQIKDWWKMVMCLPNGEFSGPVELIAPENPIPIPPMPAPYFPHLHEDPERDRPPNP